MHAYNGTYTWRKIHDSVLGGGEDRGEWGGEVTDTGLSCWRLQ